MMLNNVQKAEILKLAGERVPPKLIAEKLGLGVQQIYGQITAARRAGVSIPPFKTTKNPTAPEALSRDRHLAVSDRLFSLLASNAERQGKTPQELAQSLLEAALLGSGGAHV